MNSHPFTPSDADLDRILRDCGDRLIYPPTPDVVAALLQRMGASPGTAQARLATGSRSERWDEPVAELDHGGQPHASASAIDLAIPRRSVRQHFGHALKLVATILAFAAVTALLVLVFRGFDDDDPEGDQVAIAQATLTARAVQPASTPTATASIQVLPTPTISSSLGQDETVTNVFDIAWEQARLVSVTTELIDAYNASEIDQVLSLLADDVGWTDCDYTSGETVILEGKEEVRAWLEVRASDHDQLEVDRMWNQNPQADDVLVIEWEQRQSDELRALGFGTGIEPDQGTIVVFRRVDRQVLIRGFGTVGSPCDLAN